MLAIDRPTSDQQGTVPPPVTIEQRINQLANVGSVEDMRAFLAANPDRAEALDDALVQAGRFADLHELAQGRPPEPPTGVVDIYIGGGGDGSVSPVVDSYVDDLNAAPQPGRTAAYFTHTQIDQAARFADEQIAEGKIVNIIGHSYGGTGAIRAANKVEGELDMVVGVDPVSRVRGFEDAAERRYPENARSVVLIDDVRSQAPRAEQVNGDGIENTGELIGGPDPLGYRDSRVERLYTNVGHGNFAAMIDRPALDFEGQRTTSIRDRLDGVYADYLRQVAPAQE